MKAAEEKATELASRLEFNLSPVGKILLYRALITLLKEQDRDTRCACAEAHAAGRREGLEEAVLAIDHAGGDNEDHHIQAIKAKLQNLD